MGAAAKGCAVPSASISVPNIFEVIGLGRVMLIVPFRCVCIDLLCISPVWITGISSFCGVIMDRSGVLGNILPLLSLCPAVWLYSCGLFGQPFVLLVLELNKFSRTL